MNVKVLRRCLVHAPPEDREVALAVVLLDRLRQMVPHRSRPVLVPVVWQQEEVLVNVVVPDSPLLKRAAPDEAFPRESLARSSHVVRAPDHEHVFRELRQPVVQAIRFREIIVAVGPDEPVARSLRESLIACPCERIDVLPCPSGHAVDILAENERLAVLRAPLAGDHLGLVGFL